MVDAHDVLNHDHYNAPIRLSLSALETRGEKSPAHRTHSVNTHGLRQDCQNCPGGRNKAGHKAVN